ncbi:MAG: restriction endonuclease subunit S [Candidatus Thermoplasmatota archaeon]|nr:restriction endonuclease subunit S [Candidatus Thermoplasmatota archaeon]
MSHWPTYPLGTAIELAYGKSLPKNTRSEGGNIPVYGSNGIAGWHSEALVDGPTVIVGRKGSAGAVQFVEGPCFPIDTTYFVRPRAGFDFDIRFLYFQLRKLDLSRLRTATGVPGLTREDAYRELISVPPLPEQRRIVDLLSRAEGIVRLRREAEKKAAELIPALFLDTFGDPATNPKGWPTALFGEVGVLDRGRSRHRPRDAKELYGGPYPFIQTGDVANSGGRIRSHTSAYSEAGLAQSRLWQKGTLCITIAANIAKTGVLEFHACFPDSVVGFLPSDRVRTEYVQAWLGFLQPTLEANAPQAAQKNINLEILRSLPIPVPPLDVQEAFEQRCHDVVSIQSQQSAATAKSRATFNALLAQVFSE